jgi:anti-sigma regulatory factor (Ser/Thr protein kinase)
VGALALRHDASSAGIVRHSIADDLVGHDVARGSIDDVVLVASELVVNAVQHTPATSADDLDVSWEIQPEAVVVRVADPSRELPVRQPAEPGAIHGRGLAIVAAIASDWGVERSADGKLVWARVPINQA